MRIGHGYDLHTLARGRPFIMGGVRIEHRSGPLGHSDADVLLHAIMDSLLGAAALGDIGAHFPPDDPAFKDASSLTLLQEVHSMVTGAGLRVVNVDSTVVCQAPMLSPHIPEMVKNIEKILKGASVNVKATTEEGVGATGSEEAIAAHAVALLDDIKKRKA